MESTKYDPVYVMELENEPEYNDDILNDESVVAHDIETVSNTNEGISELDESHLISVDQVEPCVVVKVEEIENELWQDNKEEEDEDEDALNVSEHVVNLEQLNTSNDNEEQNDVFSLDQVEPNMIKPLKTENGKLRCHICFKLFTRLSSLKDHLNIHFDEHTYQCDVCDKSFSQARYLKAHLKIHAEKKPYNCRICNKAFYRSSCLKRHLRTHSGDQPYNCQVCNRSFADVSNMKKHLRIHFGELPYSCQICSKSFSELYRLKTHMLSHKNHIINDKESIIGNDFIDESIATNEDILKMAEKDLLSVKKMQSFTSEVEASQDNVWSKAKDDLNVHDWNLEQPSTSSFIDNKEQDDMSSLHQDVSESNQHLTTQDDDRCSSSLEMYLKSNSDDKPYTCQICNKSFCKSRYLKTHSRIHSDEKPYSCHICYKSFLRSSCLKRHLRTHSGDQPFSCRFCNRSFADASNMKKHLRIHTGDKPYFCRICSKSFSQLSKLKKHLMTHSDNTMNGHGSAFINESIATNKDILKMSESNSTSVDKMQSFVVKVEEIQDNAWQESKDDLNVPDPDLNLEQPSTSSFNDNKEQDDMSSIHEDESESNQHLPTQDDAATCQICNKLFTGLHTLKLHLKIHSGEQPYSCHICIKSFSRSSYLKTHLRIHTGEKPYSCDICHKSFARSNYLKVHYRTHSGEQPYCCHICYKSFASSSNFKRHMTTHPVE